MYNHKIEILIRNCRLGDVICATQFANGLAVIFASGSHFLLVSPTQSGTLKRGAHARGPTG